MTLLHTILSRMSVSSSPVVSTPVSIYNKVLLQVSMEKTLRKWRILFILIQKSDIDFRKAKAWAACHKLKQIWKSDLRTAIKVTALIESVLLYGSETWTMSKWLNKVLDGCSQECFEWLWMSINIEIESLMLNSMVTYQESALK